MSSNTLLNVSPFKEWIQFNETYLPTIKNLKKEEIKKQLPLSNKIQKLIEQTTNIAEKSIQEWKATPEGLLGSLKQKLLSYTQYGAVEPYLRLLGVQQNKVKPKESAATPYEFKTITDDERKKLIKKAKILKIMAIVTLVAGGALISCGLLFMLGGGLLLMHFSLMTALITIISLSAISVLGSTTILIYPLLLQSGPAKRCRIHTDSTFQWFIKLYVESKKDNIFNISEKNINDSNLHKVYSRWNESMKKIFNPKKIEKANKELQDFIAKRAKI